MYQQFLLSKNQLLDHHPNNSKWHTLPQNIQLEQQIVPNDLAFGVEVVTDLPLYLPKPL